MKTTALLSIVVTLILTASINAMAFITVIDVHERPGVITTVANSADYSFMEMDRKYLSYRGQAEEAVALFKKITFEELPEGYASVEADINPETGTIAITLATRAFLGFEYKYFVLKKSGK